MRVWFRYSLWLCICLWAFTALVSIHAGSAMEAGLDEVKFFESHIRPLLINRCMSCHKQGNAKNGLQLDSQAGLLQGGKRGPAVDIDQPESSLLWQAVTHTHATLKMPPGKPLSKEELEHLHTWIRMGAPWTPAQTERETQESHSPLTQAFTQEDRAFWVFQPVKKPEIPEITNPQWAKNPIDHFIYRKLDGAGLQPAPEAGRTELIRRAYYDLTGLPPSPEAVQAFVEDDAPQAYERLIDRLLESPAYGERWARHWMDLARYAESDGYKADHYRPHAWRYRDYVIQSLNEDKPYNRFVMEQLAGDEIAPNDPEALIATGFLRLGIYEYNQRDVRTQWDVILNDLTDVTGDLFLGMSISCARCHDHKFDPVLQKDYYRLRAFFAPILLRNDIPAVRSEDWERYQAQNAVWEAMTEDIRRQIAAIEEPHFATGATAINKTFPDDIKAMMNKAPQERTPFEHQLAMLAHFQTLNKGEEAVQKIKGDEKKELERLYAELEKLDRWKPEPLPETMTVRDVGPFPPPTFIPGDAEQTPIEPGILSILDASPMKIALVPSASNSTGRRTALARWITHPDNPITNRVTVNRIWQFHFGEGIVATPSEFGRLGENPSHPELLDWLTVTFIEEGWSFKKLHKRIMTSAAYRQSSKTDPGSVAQVKDPQNRLLWRFHTRRLEAEEIRDSMLAVSGELQARDGGPSAKWSDPVRSIYTQVYRNKHDELLSVFDVPDGLSSTAQRAVTTTPMQALFLVNSSWTLNRARALAERIESTKPASLEAWVQQAFQIALNREASLQEQADSVDFIIQHTYLIDEEKRDEWQWITERTRSYFWDELDDSERLPTVEVVQTAIQESSIQGNLGEANTKSAYPIFVLAGGEGGPHYRLTDSNACSTDPIDAGIHSHYSVSPNTQTAAFIDFCHILLNSSEFLYVQ